jgi:hypothetical protein
MTNRKYDPTRLCSIEFYFFHSHTLAMSSLTTMRLWHWHPRRPGRADPTLPPPLAHVRPCRAVCAHQTPPPGPWPSGLAFVACAAAANPHHGQIQKPAVATAATLEGLRLTSLSVSRGGREVETPPSLRATHDADLAVRNPSPVAAFAHDAGRVEVYRGALAADTNLRPGRVGAGGTEAITVRLTVLADLVGAGGVPFIVRTVVPGEVTVLGVLKHCVVVTTACDVVMSVRSLGTETSSCRFRTKL